MKKIKTKIISSQQSSSSSNFILFFFSFDMCAELFFSWGCTHEIVGPNKYSLLGNNLFLNTQLFQLNILKK